MELDSLEIKIQSSFDEVIEQIDKTLSKIGEVEEKIKNFGKSNGIEEVGKKIGSLSKNLDSIGKNGAFSSMSQQMKSVEERVAQITEKYKDLGKSFKLTGSESYLQKQIDSISNSLEKAKLKKQELETSGKTEGQMFEYAVRDVIKYENQIEGLKEQLSSIESAKPELKIERLGNLDDVANDITESMRTASIPLESLNYNAEAMRAVFGEGAEEIKNYADAVEKYGEHAGEALNDLGAKTGLEELEEKLSKLKIPKIKEENLEKLNNALAKSENKLDELRVKMQNGLMMGSVTANIDDSAYVKMREQIALAEKKVEELKKKIGELGGSDSKVSKLSGAFQKVKSSLSKVGGVAKKAGQGLASAAKKVGSFSLSLLKGKKNSNGFNSSLNGGLKGLLKYGLGIRSLFALFNKLRNALKDGVNNLVQYSSGANQSVSLLKNSMTQLKNASASMVAPLIEAFAPALNQVIQLCIRAANSVNQLLSSLTGKSTWIKAKTLTDDYASSLNNASKAAKGSTRAFDELKVINTNDSSGSSGTSAKDMFETVNIESQFAEMAERIKKMWEEADFTELGTIVGTRIKNALDNIDWGGIQNTANKIGKSIGTFINGSIETEGLGNTIGKTIGEAINTGIMGINAFLDNTHWDSVGKFLGDGANGVVDYVNFEDIGHMFAQKWNAIFETIGEFARTFDWVNFGLELSNGLTQAVSDFNWEESAESLSDFVKGCLDTIITFLEETDWQDIGNKVADFIGAIDWNGLFDKLSEGIGAVLGGLAGFLWGLIEDAWDDVVDWWEDTAYEDGEFTMQGLLDGIWEKIKDIGKWIDEHIFQPFIDGFKKAFGIHSPSTVMKEQGGYIIDGLKKGIEDKIQSVKDTFDKIKKKILDVWDETKKKTNEKWSEIKSNTSSKWSDMKKTASGTFDTIKSKIVTSWNTVKQQTSNIWNQIANVVKKPINSIIGFVNGMISGIVSGMNTVIRTLNKVKISIPSWIPGYGGKSFGFNLSTISAPKIPYLAKGAVFEGGNPYLAVVNDQPKGQTNIEAPLKTIQMALREELLGTTGKTATVASGKEIVGISDTIREKSNEELALLRQQNALLQALLEKETGITKDDVGRAAQSYARDYFRRTGREAYSF